MRRIFSAFGYSLDGIHSAWRNEHAFRQEVLLTLTTATFACILPVSSLERLLLIGVFALVLILELLNSAIEAVVDRVSLAPNPLSKNAKDYGSAAVLIALIFAGATWITILWKLWGQQI